MVTGKIISEDIDNIINQLGDRFQALGGSTLLVTGASGFLCSYFAETVAALNERVLTTPCRLLAVDNSPTRFSERLSHIGGKEGIRFIQADVTRPLNLDEKVDWIIHGASIASPTFYRQHPLETIDVNVTGTRHMLDLAERDRARGILFLSTSEIYGDPDPAFIPTPEEYRGYVSCTGPRACYDESKRLGETLCMTYHSLYKTPVKIVRPFNVYGPGQSLNDKRIIPDLMRSALSHEPIVLFSDGRASRAFCYISDAVSAMWQILLSDANGEVFNVGNDQTEISIDDLARLLSQIAVPALPDVQHHVSNDPNYLTDNPKRRCPDLTRLRSRFGWQPEVSLSEGLTRTLRSYLEDYHAERRGECA